MALQVLHTSEVGTLVLANNTVVQLLGGKQPAVHEAHSASSSSSDGDGGDGDGDGSGSAAEHRTGAIYALPPSLRSGYRGRSSSSEEKQAVSDTGERPRRLVADKGHGRRSSRRKQQLPPEQVDESAPQITREKLAKARKRRAREAAKEAKKQSANAASLKQEEARLAKLQREVREEAQLAKGQEEHAARKVRETERKRARIAKEKRREKADILARVEQMRPARIEEAFLRFREAALQRREEKYESRGVAVPIVVGEEKEILERTAKAEAGRLVDALYSVDPGDSEPEWAASGRFDAVPIELSERMARYTRARFYTNYTAYLHVRLLGDCPTAGAYRIPDSQNGKRVMLSDGYTAQRVYRAIRECVEVLVELHRGGFYHGSLHETSWFLLEPTVPEDDPVKPRPWSALLVPPVWDITDRLTEAKAVDGDARRTYYTLLAAREEAGDVLFSLKDAVTDRWVAYLRARDTLQGKEPSLSAFRLLQLFDVLCMAQIALRWTQQWKKSLSRLHDAMRDMVLDLLGLRLSLSGSVILVIDDNVKQTIEDNPGSLLDPPHENDYTMQGLRLRLREERDVIAPVKTHQSDESDE